MNADERRFFFSFYLRRFVGIDQSHYWGGMRRGFEDRGRSEGELIRTAAYLLIHLELWAMFGLSTGFQDSTLPGQVRVLAISLGPLLIPAAMFYAAWRARSRR